MFNKNKKSFLVIEKNTYFPKEETFRVSKSANSLDEAIGYKLALEKLNERSNQKLIMIFNELYYVYCLHLFLLYLLRDNPTTDYPLMSSVNY